MRTISIPCKFLPNEEVWLLHLDKICIAKVCEVWIDATVKSNGLSNEASQVIKYFLTSFESNEYYPTADPIYEKDLFASEQDLINFLKREIQ